MQPTELSPTNTASRSFVRHFNPAAVADLENLIDELLDEITSSGCRPVSHTADFGDLSITVIVVAIAASPSS